MDNGGKGGGGGQEWITEEKGRDPREINRERNHECLTEGEDQEWTTVGERDQGGGLGWTQKGSRKVIVYNKGVGDGKETWWYHVVCVDEGGVGEGVT